MPCSAETAAAVAAAAVSASLPASSSPWRQRCRTAKHSVVASSHVKFIP